MFYRLNRVFLSACFIACGHFAQAGVSEQFADHTIVFRPALPLENQPMEVEVSVKPDQQSEKPTVVTLFRDGQKIDSAEVVGEGNAVFKLSAGKNGFTDFRAELHYGDGTTASVSRKAAVITRPLYFYYYGYKDPALLNCQWANVVQSLYPREKKPSPEYWRRRGVRVLNWASGGKRYDPAVTEEKYLSGFTRYHQNNTDGFAMDELGGYDPEKMRSSNLHKAIRKYCQEYPEKFVALWNCGYLKPEVCSLMKTKYRGKYGADLLLLEVYYNCVIPEFATMHPWRYFQHAIDVARQYDVLEQSLMGIGTRDFKNLYHNVNTTEDDLENQIRYIRTHAPEMPGIALFASYANQELTAAVDRFTEKYFLSPVLTGYAEDFRLSDYTPKAGDTITVSAFPVNIGGMDSGPVKVRFYDGDPALPGAEVIGEVALATLPAQKLEYETVTLRGKSVERKVLNASPKSRVDLKWTPKRRGSHWITVEIVPENAADTLLENVFSKRVFVR